MEPHHRPLVHVVDRARLRLLPLVPFLPLLGLGYHSLSDCHVLLDQPYGGVDRTDRNDPMILAQVGRPQVEQWQRAPQVCHLLLLGCDTIERFRLCSLHNRSKLAAGDVSSQQALQRVEGDLSRALPDDPCEVLRCDDVWPLEAAFVFERGQAISDVTGSSIVEQRIQLTLLVHRRILVVRRLERE